MSTHTLIALQYKCLVVKNEISFNFSTDNTVTLRSNSDIGAYGPKHTVNKISLINNKYPNCDRHLLSFPLFFIITTTTATITTV